MNHYDVIYIDMTGVKPATDGFHSLVPFLTERLTVELMKAYPGIPVSADFSSKLVNAVERAGNRFIAIIDEWDAPIREAPETQKEYLEFLRSLFKNSGVTSKVFAAAYMTGILPIKKDGSQSAISDFQGAVNQTTVFCLFSQPLPSDIPELCAMVPVGSPQEIPFPGGGRRDPHPLAGDGHGVRLFAGIAKGDAFHREGYGALGTQ